VFAQLFGDARELAKRPLDEQLRAHALADRRREGGRAHRAGEEHDRIEKGPAPRAAAMLRRDALAQARQRLVVDRAQPVGVVLLGEQQREQIAEVGCRRCHRQHARAQPLAEFAPQVHARGKAEVGKQRGVVDLAPEAAQHLGHAGPVLGVAVEHAEQVLQAQHRGLRDLRFINEAPGRPKAR
jgi:hypothetical protein